VLKNDTSQEVLRPPRRAQDDIYEGFGVVKA